MAASELPTRKNVAVYAHTLVDINAIAKKNGLKQIDFVNTLLSIAISDADLCGRVVEVYREVNNANSDVNKLIHSTTEAQRKKIKKMLESGEI